VQHDGGGWRCLVARPLAAILESHFLPKNPPQQIRPSCAEPKLAFSWSPMGVFVPAPNA
jgi:hypothetical protein